MHTAPRTLRRQAPRTRARQRKAAKTRRPALGRRRRKVILAASALLVAVLVWAGLSRAFAPTGNTSASRFDAIIVLGATIDRDGNPSPVLLSRLSEGVREYGRGVAPHIIVTGGPDHGYDEADRMGRVLEAQGVPASVVIPEPRAKNTIQNACFSARIMKAHGWTSAEVVTSPSHLSRAGLIFSRTPMQWRVHAAPPLEPQSALATDFAGASELVHTVYYLLYSSWAERCSP